MSGCASCVWWWGSDEKGKGRGDTGQIASGGRHSAMNVLAHGARNRSLDAADKLDHFGR